MLFRLSPSGTCTIMPVEVVTGHGQVGLKRFGQMASKQPEGWGRVQQVWLRRQML